MKSPNVHTQVVDRSSEDFATMCSIPDESPAEDIAIQEFFLCGTATKQCKMLRGAPAPVILELNSHQIDPERKVLTGALYELQLLRELFLDPNDGLTQSIWHLIHHNLQMSNDKENTEPVLLRLVHEQMTRTYTQLRYEPRCIATILYLYLFDTPLQPKDGVPYEQQDFEHTASILLTLPSKILITEALIVWMIQNPDSDFPEMIEMNGQSVDIPGWAYSVVAEILDLQPQQAPTPQGLATLRRGGYLQTPRMKGHRSLTGFATITGLTGLAALFGIGSINPSPGVSKYPTVLADIQGPDTTAAWCDPNNEDELRYKIGETEYITVRQLLTNLPSINALYSGMSINEFLDKLRAVNTTINGVQDWTDETYLPRGTTINLFTPAESASCQEYVGNSTPIPPSSTPAAGSDKDPVPENSSAQTYTVQSGDTLGEIATRYNVTVSDLQEWNGIVDPNVIVVGMTLVVTNPSDGENTGTITTSDEDTATITTPNGDTHNTGTQTVCDPSLALLVSERFQAAALGAGDENPFRQWLESYNELDINTTWGTQGWEEVFRRIQAGEALPTPVYLQALTVLYEIYTTESCNPLLKDSADTVREQLFSLAKQNNPFETNNVMSPQGYQNLLDRVNNIIMGQILTDYKANTDMGRAIRAFFDNSMSMLEMELTTDKTGRGVGGIYDGDLRTLYKSLMLIVLATDKGNVENNSFQSSLDIIRQIFQAHGNENSTSFIEIVVAFILLFAGTGILIGLSHAIGPNILKKVPMPDPLSAIRNFWSGR